MAHDGTSVTITRRLAAAPARVFRAFVDGDDLAAWVWGSMASRVDAHAEGRVGGRYWAYTDAPEGMEDEWPSPRWGVMGVYAVLDEPDRLVYTIHWDGPVGYNQGDECVADEVVVVDLVPAGGGAELTMRHLGIPDDGVSSAEHERGIEDMLDALAALVEG